ncbi:dTMP kinase [Aciduricibacillus chroicocephali]|uniref:Thymidylate kinase n=1 Tax=Aciduricibacillus chroicocephali TaxID=3054939 RepID=A0ABY9KVF0_9BACI|nr:dTMP kinase [Bacillaceae bacterium 44XB]
MTGHFITFEGVEGAGKTSLIRKLAVELEKADFDCLVTREPGGIPIAEQIRSVILDADNTAMDGRTEALLYAAARRQHMTEKVIPALEAGKVVLCDRFVDSSLAYQGHARGLGMEAIRQINDFAIGGVMPELTILLDMAPAEGLKRINRNADREKNRLDMEKLEFHELVREGYLILQKAEPERIRLIDADREREQICQEVLNLLKEHILISNR